MNGEVKSSIVLSGDPKQLDAVTKSKYAEKLGYNKSYMQYLFEKPVYQRTSSGKYDSSHIVQLTHNYRSHKTILYPSNELFYGGDLVPAASKGNINGNKILEKSLCNIYNI